MCHFLTTGKLFSTVANIRPKQSFSPTPVYYIEEFADIANMKKSCFDDSVEINYILYERVRSIRLNLQVN